MHQLVLASASPRRSELLRQIGVRFLICPVDIDEALLPDELPVSYVERLAVEKSQKGFICSDGEAALGSDTTVVIDGKVLGKPVSREDAVCMLLALSGRTHQVMTGVALTTSSGTQSCVVTIHVTFKSLSKDECDTYWSTGEPKDKAGAYGIQGYGAVFVESISGSYSAVVGLPLAETAELLSNAGIKIWHGSSINA